MNPIVTLFWIGLVATLAGLATTVATGRSGRRGRHVATASLSLVLLGATIVLAEAMGRQRDFPPGPMRIHLTFAISATFAVLPVVGTGLCLWRWPGWRKVHVACVALFGLLAVTAVGTGIWVFSLSTPK